jgi:molybdate transport system substrate-binding protein
MKKLLLSILLVSLSFDTLFAKDKPELLFYCGISMVKPIKEMAKIIEKEHNCIIKIQQGGSQELYDSLSSSKTGDMYLPGSNSYRKKYLKDGYLKDKQYIGYNQAALFVVKGNPKHIKDLSSLIDENLAVIIADSTTGSIGKMTKKILLKYKGEDFYDDVLDVASEIGTDSRNLNKAIIDKRADLTINWKATAFFAENKPYISIVNIDEKYVPKKKLVINALSFSKHKDIVKAFMDFAASYKGQVIMKKYGFLD